MKTIAPYLVAASAAIVLILGLIHLLYTYSGTKLLPRDSDLQARMQEVSPVITRQTTMWRGYIGFNASHSLALILFGTVYGYLALAHREFMFRSVFLLAVGLIFLLAFVFLAKMYFFRTPLLGVLLATVIYGFGIIFSRI